MFSDLSDPIRVNTRTQMTVIFLLFTLLGLPELSDYNASSATKCSDLLDPIRISIQEDKLQLFFCCLNRNKVMIAQ